MLFKISSAIAGATFAMVLGGSSAASADPLPAANCGLGADNNCLTFNDFTVYSLALLNFQAGAGQISPGDPFQVVSTPGSLADKIVIGSQPAGATNNQDLAIAGRVDDAFNIPNTGCCANFVMTPEGEPIPTFTGDTLGLWDIQVDALSEYLNGGALEFYFNLNQQNSDNTYLSGGQDMLAWMEVTFKNTDTGATTSFRLDGTDCGAGPGSCLPFIQSAAQTVGVNDILPSITDQYAYVHGQICVSDAGAVLEFNSCTGPGNTVNQNLGANTAAFGLYSLGVDEALKSGLYDIMTVDLRMAALSNGFEQLFISAGPRSVTVPEPLTLSLFGAGLVGAVLLRRRKRKAA